MNSTGEQPGWRPYEIQSFKWFPVVQTQLLLPLCVCMCMRVWLISQQKGKLNWQRMEFSPLPWQPKPLKAGFYCTGSY